MTGIQNQEADSVQNQIEFRLIDLVPRDCCQTERVDLETKLQRLEQSLNRWLREKIDAIESEQLSVSIAGTSPQLLGALSADEITRSDRRMIGQEKVIPMSTDDRE